MTFKKGTSGNYKGRPKGSATKSHKKVKEAFAHLLQNNLAQLQQCIDSMSPKDKASFLLRCSEFILPKPSRTKLGEESGKTTSGLRNWVITPVSSSHED